MTELVTITATNSSGEVVGTMTIDPRIAPPVFNGPIPDLVVTEGVPFSYNAAQHFAGKQLTYALSDAPEWATINPTTGVISGTAPA